MKFRATLICSVLFLSSCGFTQAPQRATFNTTTKNTGDASGQSPSTADTKTNPDGSSASGTVYSGDKTPATPVTPVTPVVPVPTPVPVPVIPKATAADLKVLVFSKTDGFRHGDAIEEGIKAMNALATKHGFTVVASEDSAVINKANLAKFNVVFFLDTTGEFLNDVQRKDFQEYVEGGGGFIGTHSAADSLYTWPWYETLVGAWFGGHSGEEPAKVKVENKTHPSTSFLPDVISRQDEWYNYRTNPRPNVTILMTVDETSYAGGRSNNDHPISWCHDVMKGRSWYSGFGHNRSTFQDAQFQRVLVNAMLWTAHLDVAVGE